MPWPFPGDAPVARARKVALAYRHALLAADPEAAHALDRRMIGWGQFWVVPRDVVYADDEWITAAQAAELACTTPGYLRELRRRGRLHGRLAPDGRSYLYRAGDIYRLSTAVRRRSRGASDTLPANGTRVPPAQTSAPR
jgi:hypothetical protein